MLAFITSLRHPDNSADYERVERLLQETLHSIRAQTSDDYVVIVVGNRVPAFPLPDRMRFVQVDFPAPAPAAGPQTDRAAFVWDKGTKIGIGLIAASEYDPDYVMIFDADDFLHRDLVRFVRDHPSEAGWVISRGVVYSRRRNVYRQKNHFNRSCGTSYIVAYDAYGVPQHLTPSATQGVVADGFGDRLNRILGAHREALEWFAGHGVQLRRLPFRGAVYQVDTGENHSGQSLHGVAWPLGAGAAERYGIVPSRSMIDSARFALGPAALWETVRAVEKRLRRLFVRA